MMKQELMKTLDIEITNIRLFELAFTHKSAINESNVLNTHNERLEFLGDAVLELIITEYLYFKYPSLKEGTLTSLRASVVKGETLAEIAKELNLGQFLKVSKGEGLLGGREKNSLLANTFEALLGAIYIDTGIEMAKKVVFKFLLPKLNRIIQKGEFIDAKSYFQQYAQAKFKITPHYKEIESFGPDHDKTFKIGVFLEDKKIAIGSGHSKQIAQQEAAKNALNKFKIKWQEDLG